MFVEFIISIIAFIILTIIAAAWQPTRFILKEVFKNPLKDSPDTIVSNYNGQKAQSERVEMLKKRKESTAS